MLCAIGFALLLASSAAQAGTIVTNVDFLGSFDLSTCKTYEWIEGTPAPSAIVEHATHAAVEKQLSKKGAKFARSSADCYVRTHLFRDELFPGGELRVEILSGAEKSIVWRGRAAGVVTTQDPAKRGKMAARAVKMLFKHFPKVE